MIACGRKERKENEDEEIHENRAVLMAIIALALMPAAALATTTAHQLPVHSNPLTWIVELGLGMAGTVTVTYSSFAADNPTPQFGTPFTGGSAVAPTAEQAAQVNRINALIGFTDSDQTFTLTHNWNLSAAAQAANEPDISSVSMPWAVQHLRVG